jgi:hypothetical protein
MSINLSNEMIGLIKKYISFETNAKCARKYDNWNEDYPYIHSIYESVHNKSDENLNDPFLSDIFTSESLVNESLVNQFLVNQSLVNYPRCKNYDTSFIYLDVSTHFLNQIISNLELEQPSKNVHLNYYHQTDIIDETFSDDVFISSNYIDTLNINKKFATKQSPVVKQYPQYLTTLIHSEPLQYLDSKILPLTLNKLLIKNFIHRLDSFDFSHLINLTWIEISEYVNIGYVYRNFRIYWPPYLKKLILSIIIHHDDIKQLPDSLEELSFRVEPSIKEINHWPHSLKKLNMIDYNGIISDLPTNLKYVSNKRTHWWEIYGMSSHPSHNNFQIVLTPGIDTLNLGGISCSNLMSAGNISINTITLIASVVNNSSLFTKNLTQLYLIDCEYNLVDCNCFSDLNSLKVLQFHELKDSQILANLPTSLVNLSVHMKFHKDVDPHVNFQSYPFLESLELGNLVYGRGWPDNLNVLSILGGTILKTLPPFISLLKVSSLRTIDIFISRNLLPIKLKQLIVSNYSYYELFNCDKFKCDEVIFGIMYSINSRFHLAKEQSKIKEGELVIMKKINSCNIFLICGDALIRYCNGLSSRDDNFARAPSQFLYSSINDFRQIENILMNYALRKSNLFSEYSGSGYKTHQIHKTNKNLLKVKFIDYKFLDISPEIIKYSTVLTDYLSYYLDPLYFPLGFSSTSNEAMLLELMNKIDTEAPVHNPLIIYTLTHQMDYDFMVCAMNLFNLLGMNYYTEIMAYLIGLII